MDESTIGRSIEDFLNRCSLCNREYNNYCGWRGRRKRIYGVCRHIICQECLHESPNMCRICLTDYQDGHTIYQNGHTIYDDECQGDNVKYTPGCRVLTKKELEELRMEKLRLENKVKEEISRTKEEDQAEMELERTRFEEKIKELEMEKKAATELKEQFEMEKNRLEMELKTEKIKAKTEHGVKKVSFSCSECDFPVAEYRSHICVDCGLSSGFLAKEDQNLRLNADTQQIEKENLMCVGCAIEGVHAGHQTANYQQLKLGPISIEKKKKNDSELAEKRDTVVNSQTMIAVARLLQTARVELSKLSEETVNAVTWDEFSSTWNAADIELSRAHSITENFLNVADDTEKSLEKVVTGLAAIRTGCKVFVNNSGKGDISEDANREDIKTDCSASVITDASEWQALSESTEQSLEEKKQEHFGQNTKKNRNKKR